MKIKNMGKGPLRFLISSIVILIIYTFIQCDRMNDVETVKIKKYLKEQYQVKLADNINKIYIINDMGCGNCIVSFSEFIKRYINDDNTLIIINSRGINVDLDTFRNKKKNNSNIIINYATINDPDDLFYHSGVVYMDKEKVDTIIHLSGNEIANQLKYIFSRK